MHDNAGEQLNCITQPMYAALHGPSTAHCQHASQSVGAVQSTGAPVVWAVVGSVVDIVVLGSVDVSAEPEASTSAGGPR